VVDELAIMHHLIKMRINHSTEVSLMRNALLGALTKATVLLAILAHWVLDDIIVILPTIAVDAMSKMIFKLTGNEYRFKEFQAFWNKQKPVETDD